MDASCTIQDSIHVFSLVHKYVSSILGTYHYEDIGFFISKLKEDEFDDNSLKTYRVTTEQVIHRLKSIFNV